MALIVPLCAALSACGGGGGGSTATTPVGTAGATDTPTTEPNQTVDQPVALPLGTKLNDAACAYQYSVTASSVLTGADPLLSNQWYLQNTGQSGGTTGEDINALAAWTNFPSRGAGVRVAVIDDSVEITHDDLAPNVVAGLSHNYRTAAPYPTYPMPCKSTDIHGTSVAGVLLGRDGNGVGVAGVASRASLVAYNALATSLQADIGDALTRDSQATSIYNSSWGSADNGWLHPVDNVFKNAIQYGATKGRGGKGSIYLFPAGNGGCYYTYPGFGLTPTQQDPNACNGYSDNSNFDGYSNSPNVIAVCAVDDTGIRPWYGERGANILVCGSSSDRGHATNAIDDKRGYVTSTAVNNAYRSDFSGTSASTPQVSGIVALMLAERPDLTARDVRLILARTARQNAPTDPDWTTNGVYHFNHKYGVGVADASAAVALARTWTSVGAADSLVTCTTIQRAPNVLIPDAAAGATSSDPLILTPITDNLPVASNACAVSKIEYVQVNFVSGHTYGGDLKIELISPSGLVSELATPRACFHDDAADSPGDYVTCRTGAPWSTAVFPADADYADSVGGWTFSTVRHLDESPTGVWQLRVTDSQAGDQGNLVRWSLTIAGR